MSNISWTGSLVHSLDELQAFDAMRFFIQAYWERGGKSQDDIAVLLGSLNRDRALNSAPLDIAQWEDWRAAIKASWQAE